MTTPRQTVFLIMSAGILVLFLAVTVSGYNDDKPIYKWSPLIFRSLKKDMTSKQSVYQTPRLQCGPERSSCDYRRYLYGYSSFNYPKHCCKGLVCERIGDISLCIRPIWETNEIYPIY